MAQILLQSSEELAQFSLVELNLSLAERVDQVTDTTAHDLSTLAPIQPLLLNLSNEIPNTTKNFGSYWHALRQIAFA